MFTYREMEFLDYDELAEEYGLDNFLLGKPAKPPTPERIGMGRALSVATFAWGLTLSETANVCGLSVDGYLGMLRGTRVPAPSRLKVIADRFGWTVEGIQRLAAELVPVPADDYQI